MVVKKLEDLKCKVQTSLNERQKHAAKVKKLEDTFDIIGNLLSKSEPVLDEEKVELVSSDLISHEIDVCQQLLDKSREINIGEMLDDASNIKEKLSSADRLHLDDKVQTVKRKLDGNISVTAEKVRKLQDDLRERKTQEKNVNQFVAKMKEIQKDMDVRSAKPIGCKVDDAKKLVEAYSVSQQLIFSSSKLSTNVHKLNLFSFQEVLAKLNDLSCEAKELQHSLLSTSSNLAENLEVALDQCYQALNIAEMRQTKAKQSLDHRKVFHKVVEDITVEVDEVTEVIRTFESGDKSSSKEKVQELDRLITRIIHSEASLAAARDKSDVILAEGSVSDKNQVGEMLQMLKNQLSNLKRRVEKIKSQHEASLAQQQKFIQDLNAVLVGLEKAETDLNPHPLLGITVESVDGVIRNFKVISPPVCFFHPSFCSNGLFICDLCYRNLQRKCEDNWTLLRNSKAS